MEKIKAWITIMRPSQYYKNLIIFLALFFSGNLFDIDKLIFASGGVIAFSLVSSSVYILNDIFDIKKDLYNKEKGNKPIANKQIHILPASLFAFILFFLSAAIAFYIKISFFSIVVAYFFLTLTYSAWLKKLPFLDIIMISINFVLRAIAGGIIIDVLISPWLIIGTFFLALFLAAGKRKSEKIFLGQKLDYRPVLSSYTEPMINSLVQLSSTTLIIAYALYCILGPYVRLIITLPIALYMILRYMFLIYQGSEKVRMTGKIFTDKQILIALTLYMVVSTALLYLDIIPLKWMIS